MLTHVEMFIQRHVQKVAPSVDTPTGLLSHGDAFCGRCRPISAGRLYVDPEDGIIKIAQRRLRDAPSLIPASDAVADRRMGPHSIAINKDGVWYAVGLRSFGHTSDDVLVALFRIGNQFVVEWIDPLFGPVLAHDTEKLRLLAARYGDGLIGDTNAPDWAARSQTARPTDDRTCVARG
jgi:hypothetical protein